MNLGNNVKTWNLACGACLLAIVAIAAYDFFTPKPNLAKARKAAGETQRSLTLKVESNRKALADNEMRLASFTWKIPPDEVGSALLAKITDLAKKHNVKVGNFRPSRPNALDKLMVLGFDLSLNGSATDTSDFLKEFELPENLVSIQSYQLTNADGASDAVNATVKIIAIVQVQEKEKKTPEKPTQTKTTQPTTAKTN